MRKILAIVLVVIIMLATIEMAIATEAESEVNGIVTTSECPIGTVGITPNAYTLNFGTLYPGQPSAPQPLTLTITASGYIPTPIGACTQLAPTTILVTLSATQWLGIIAPHTMIYSRTAVSGSITAFDGSTSLPVGSESALEFIMTPTSTALPDTYSQTITITGIY